MARMSSVTGDEIQPIAFRMGDAHVLFGMCFPNSPFCCWECQSQSTAMLKQNLFILNLLSLLQAFLFPKLLGGEFTRFEFPRRLKGDDVGQKVLYRDYFMEGW